MKHRFAVVPLLAFLSLAACSGMPGGGGGQSSSSSSEASSVEVSSAASSSPYADEIRVTSPVSGAVVASPLGINGTARGTWYFEASFPVKIKDANGTVLGQGPAQAQGDWMTTDFVPFSAVLTFTPSTTPTGTLVLQNDNPSGDPANQKEIDIPVHF
jgi:hypothetical protein